ncbi:hypothetical protein, partial [Acetobacter malorum]|uniref:hypothetical protein n=1 Tax=Acetobacter malorum TaxID=178901 RepID=UPI0039EB4F59
MLPHQADPSIRNRSSPDCLKFVSNPLQKESRNKGTLSCCRKATESHLGLNNGYYVFYCHAVSVDAVLL